MLEATIEGGTIRLLYNDDGPVERVLIGEASPGECPPLISKAPVGLGDAVEEAGVLTDAPDGAILDALTSSQPPDAGEAIWPFRISYACGLTERRPSQATAYLRALVSADAFGPAEVIDEMTAETLPV